MSEKKYQVFISSTFADLKEERRKILDILLMADCIPAGMEAFVASDVEQFEVIKRVIDLCDYYVLVIGKRYGSIHPVTGKSYTEMEYDYAKEKGIPVLVFALDESVVLPEEKCESDSIKITALNEFRKKALDNRLASIWTTVAELTGQVAIAIMRAKNEIKRPGWQRATDYDEASLRREIMESDKERRRIQEQASTYERRIQELTKTPDIKFDDFEFVISCEIHQSTLPTSISDITVSLPDVFCVIATQMLDISIQEHVIAYAIKRYILPYNWSTCEFSDPQIIKKILLHLKELGLIQSSFDSKSNLLFWGLTEKGEVERNKRMLATKYNQVKK